MWKQILTHRQTWIAHFLEIALARHPCVTYFMVFLFAPVFVLFTVSLLTFALVYPAAILLGY